MIEVSRLNGELIHVNPDLLRWVEAKPDTTLCFTDGQCLVVRETPERVRQLIIDYRRQIINGSSFTSEAGISEV